MHYPGISVNVYLFSGKLRYLHFKISSWKSQSFNLKLGRWTTAVWITLIFIFDVFYYLMVKIILLIIYLLLACICLKALTTRLILGWRKEFILVVQKVADYHGISNYSKVFLWVSSLPHFANHENILSTYLWKLLEFVW